METITSRSRFRGSWWAVGTALVALVALSGIARADESHSMRGSAAHDHDHNGHDDHAEHLEHSEAPAAAASDSSASIWKRVTLYEFDTIGSERALSFCTTKRAITSMVFTMLPVSSTVKEQLEAVARDANRMADAFDSTVVTRRDISRDTPVQVYSLADLEMRKKKSTTTYAGVLYRAQLKMTPSMNPTRCIDAVLNVSGTGIFVLFAEHAQANVSISMTDSFQREVHYTSCITGCDNAKSGDNDPDSQSLGSSTSSSSRSGGPAGWGAPVLASIAIALTSLVGVLVLSLGRKHVDVVVDYMMSFAAGCLLAVTVFHLYPEGSAYIADMGEWVSGTCVLAGIAFSMGFEQSLHLLLTSLGARACAGSNGSHGHGHGGDEHKPQEKEDAKNDFDMLESYTSRTSQHVSVLLQSLPSAARAPHRRQQQQTMSQSFVVLGNNDGERSTEHSDHALTFRQKYISSLHNVAPIAWITAMGDFFHAFTDGVVIAVAFKSCSSSLGWAVALGVVLHEVPHRVGDYFIFLKAGMLVSQALVLNFIASLASLLAVVIVLSVGDVGAHTLGIMLSVGAGALLFIAMVKLLPPMLDVRARGQAFVHFLAFALGCILIGLSMLQHAHCEATGSTSSSNSHDGHNH